VVQSLDIFRRFWDGDIYNDDGDSFFDRIKRKTNRPRDRGLRGLIWQSSFTNSFGAITQSVELCKAGFVKSLPEPKRTLAG